GIAPSARPVCGRGLFRGMPAARDAAETGAGHPRGVAAAVRAAMGVVPLCERDKAPLRRADSMCGIAGIYNLAHEPIPGLDRDLSAMNRLQQHRGPDGEGRWQHARGFVGLAHQRLSIIDLAMGQQPMSDGQGNWISYNGEIYNYRELREELGADQFVTQS